MCFKVGFINNIKSIFITQFIPTCLVRIVRRTNSIDVMLFHHFDIPKHIFFSDTTSCSSVKFVSVNPFKDNSLTIQKHEFIFNFEVSKSNFNWNDFNNLVIIQNMKDQIVKFRTFSTPRFDFKIFKTYR